MHPDKSKEEDAEVKFRQINAVYEILKDSEKRQVYDNVLDNGLPDWRQPLYYYRKVKKMGLGEILIILSLMTTAGHYIFLWTSYCEKKFVMQEITKPKKIKRDKKKKTKAEIEAEQEESEEKLTEDIEKSVEKPTLINLLPIAICIGLYSFLLSLPGVYNEAMARRRQLKEQELLRIEEQKRLEEEELKKIERRKASKKAKAEAMEQLLKRDFSNEYRAEPFSYVQLNTTDEEKEPKHETSGSSLPWNSHEISQLAKAMKKFPGGTLDRWEKIAYFLKRSVDDVSSMAKKVKQGVSTEALTSNEVIVKKRRAVATDDITVRDKEINEDQRYSKEKYICDEDVWTQNQQKILEWALANYPKTVKNRWEQISEQIPGKTKDQCISRVNNNALSRETTELLPIILKDDSTRRTLLQDPGFHEYLSSKPEVLAQLWMNAEDRELILQQEVLVNVMKRDDFKDAEEVENLKKIIPNRDILVYALLNPLIVNVIERDRELQESVMKDESMQTLIKINNDVREKLTSLNGPAYLCSLLREPEVCETLLNLPETKCRIDRVKNQEGQVEVTLPVLNYTKIEMDIFEKDVKRAMYTLNKNVYFTDKKMSTRKPGEDISYTAEDFSGDDHFRSKNLFRTLKDSESEKYALLSLKDVKNRGNISNNNYQSTTFFDDSLGVCDVLRSATAPSTRPRHLRANGEADADDGSAIEETEMIKAQQVKDAQAKIGAMEKELGEKSVQLEFITGEYERLKERSMMLEKVLQEKNDELREGLLTLVENGQINLTSSIVESEMKVKSMEIEIDKLKHDAESSKDSLNKTLKDNTELTRKLKEFTRQLMIEKSIVAQLMASRVDLEDALNNSFNERDQFKAELIKFEEKAMKMENQSQEILSSMESETLKLKKDYEEAVAQLKEDNRILMGEIVSSKSEAEARSCEMSQTRNLLNVANLEIEDLNRKLEFVTEDNLSNREELEKVMSEYDEKTKQVCIMKELIEKLKAEKERLSSDRFAFERDIERLSEELERTKDDIIENSRRLGDARNSSLESEKLYNNAQNMIISLQGDLRNVQSQIAAAEDEKKCLNSRLSKFTDQNKLLQKDNQRLKQQALTDQQILKEERKKISNMRGELNFLNDAQEKMRIELEMVQAAFDKEQNLHMSLREQYLLEEKQQAHLVEKIKNYEQEVSNLEQRIRQERLQMEQLRNENEKLIEESKNSFRKLEMCEDMLQREQNKYKHAIDNIREDFISDISHVKKDKQNMEDIVKSLREEVVDLKEQLRTKDLQIRSCYQSIGQMESEAKGRKELECQLMQSELELKESQTVIDNISEDLRNEREKHSVIAQQNDKLRMNIEQMKEGIKLVKEEYTKEVFLLRSELFELSNASREEINQLQNELNKSKTDLNITEASLLALQEVRETLSSKNTNFDKTIDALKKRLYQEISSRKLAEEHVKALRQQSSIGAYSQSVDESTQERMTPTAYKSLLDKIEQELQIEKEQNLQLKNKLNITETSSMTKESHIQTLELQITEITSENSTLKRKIDNIQNVQQSKSIPDQDLKNRLKLYEKERAVFFQSAQKLAVDLENNRALTNEKTKEIIKLEEYIISLKEQINNSKVFNNNLTETIYQQRNDEEIKLKLELRNSRLKSPSLKRNDSTNL
ncbi:DgyrCDS9080 [Dimorphilus gyrociliatus]|uniref:DgyrCDS9080 n=1 Tax=Dimorphilus gyrociliatus TaxID=2664684 RepID=A0A7I8VYD0_9ANNE|nr:DgyrCDS9080 [Dimorphilus gyrociliatus]